MRYALRALRLVTLFLGALFLTACGEQVSWNQKIAINVDTPDGLKSGSSVTRAIFAKKREGFLFNPPEARGVGSAVSGEAVVVDLGEGQYLFGLLGAGGTAQCAIDWGTDRWWPAGARNVSRHAGVVPLEGSCRPRLVTFDDIDDPASVKSVDADDFAASFGADYALQSITLEITNEPTTEGKVEAVLEWLADLGRQQGNLKGKPPSGLVADQADPAIWMIGPSDFSTRLFD
ncbi:MAG: hypothetical protein AAF940_02865 [Pseudomonadota bacterium]